MIAELMTSPQTALVVKAVGNALLHSLWQCAMIGAIAGLALRALRGASPQARYAVACGALLACTLWPAVELSQALATSGWRSAPAAAVITGGDTMPAIRDGGGTVERGAFPFEATLPWLVAVWACGASLMLLRLAAGLRWVARLRRTALTGPDPEWQRRLDALARRFGLRGIRLAVFDGEGGPLSAGIWRPVVLIPAALLTRLPPDMLEALLAHELAHIRRHDYLVNLLQSAAEALLFFHPVVWWLSRRIREEREQVADHVAAAVLGEPRQLALALAELDRCILSPPNLAQAAHGGHLMSRIQSLLRPQHPTRAGAAVLPLAALAIACIGCFAYAKSSRNDPTGTGSAAIVPAAVAPSVKVGALVASAQKRASATRSVIDDARETIALVEHDRNGVRMSGNADDIDEIQDAKARIDGDFIWLQRNGQVYVVRDPQTVAKVRELWNTESETERKMEALSAEMELHSGKIEAISTRMDAVTPDSEGSPQMRDAIRQLQTLAREQEALARQQEALAMGRAEGKAAEDDNALIEALDRKMSALNDRMEALGEVVESESGKLQAQLEPMEALSAEMEAASKPMEAIGRKMEALSADFEREVERTDRQVRGEIDRAVSNGLAEALTASPRGDSRQ